MNRYLIIGRTVGQQGGFEFHWRDDNGVLPNDAERAQLVAGMNEEHHGVFDRNSQRTALVFLPDWPDAKWWKLASWRDGAEAGRVGLHVNGEIDGEGEEEPATALMSYPDVDDTAGTDDHNRRA